MPGTILNFISAAGKKIFFIDSLLKLPRKDQYNLC